MKKYLIPFVLLFSCNSTEVPPPEPVYPIPSESQLAWHDLEYYAFVHFNMNTFSDMEWGMGDESPEQFNPTELDTRQWAKVVKDAGMKGIIITAKHHDGFCLWPSAYTEHSVKNSPWKEGKGDLIRELREACDEYGLEMGIYYSPWDRNHAAYGTPEYISYMRNQLKELLTNYGDIFEVWFDGANGGTGYYGGANENRFVDKLTYYDWPKTYALVRELQPKAVMFSDGGPDVRWVGNEEGFAYETTWSNLMRDSVYAGMPEYPEKYASGQENGTHWVPAEADVSIRPGWYYHAYEDHKVKTLPQLLDIYYNSIGRNASLLINFPVDRRGLIHEKDVEQIMKLSTKIKEDFAVDFVQKAKLSASNERGRGFEISQVLKEDKNKYWAAEDGVIHNEILIKFPQKQDINRFLAQEHIALGQRIKEFTLEAKTQNGWQLIHKGSTIGTKRILRFDEVETDELRFTILDAKASPTFSRLAAYLAPKLITEPFFRRDQSGTVSLSIPEKSVDIYYTLDGSIPDSQSNQYENPIKIDKPVRLNAISYDPSSGKSSEVFVKDLDIAKAQWKVIHTETDAAKAIDEDPSTFWSSNNQELTVDLGEVIHIKGFTYLPPQNRFMRGVISKYSFQSSMDGKTWTERAKGEFPNIHNNPIEQMIRFEDAQARYVKLKSLGTTDNQAASFAEIGVITID
ncbi:alpha-L-fucosidase [Fontibacter flavus]|uniref:alpha-L-fucosidase n=1 Tax=Fontibacter flavus TaxID=654838 RepID=A0ABV6FRG5_9BACT